jgi:cytochrome c
VKKILSFVGLFAISGVLGIQLVQPASAIRQPPSQEAPILVGAHADAHVSSLIEKSCQNCHSLKTEWPLYSRIFPFSLLIEHDVQTARTQMNLSRWQIYEDSEKSLMLSEIGSVVRNRIMPPRRYTMIHPEAKLSEAEVNEIYQWTRADRRLLNHSREK